MVSEVSSLAQDGVLSSFLTFSSHQVTTDRNVAKLLSRVNYFEAIARSTNAAALAFEFQVAEASIISMSCDLTSYDFLAPQVPLSFFGLD